MRHCHSFLVGLPFRRPFTFGAILPDEIIKANISSMNRRIAKLAAAIFVATAMAAQIVWADEAGNKKRIWQTLKPGMEMCFLEAGAAARVGSERVAVLRIDPNRFRFKVLLAKNGDDEKTAGEWREATGAVAVFNAGQYAEDHSYLGLLVQDGKIIGRLAGRQDAMFLAEPSDPSLRNARIIDLRYSAFDPKANPYFQAAQSLMLLDRFGHIRVRRSAKIAHRTALGMDDHGRVLVMVTEGAMTLWEYAEFLSGAGLGLREVMLMDGGGESQLDLKIGRLEYEQYGGPSPTPDLLWPRQVLPAALAVLPR